MQKDIYRKSRGYINNFVVILDETYDIKTAVWSEAPSKNVNQISLTGDVTMQFGTMTSSFVKE